MESVDPEEPAKVKAEPGEHFITEILTTEAAQDEMAGLTESLARSRDCCPHHDARFRFARGNAQHFADILGKLPRYQSARAGRGTGAGRS